MTSEIFFRAKTPTQFSGTRVIYDNRTEQRAMVIRLAGLAVLAFVLAGWTPSLNPTFQVAQNAESGDKAMDAAQLADREMNTGRYNIDKRNYIGAINRFKTVITRYPTSAEVEEALARLSESYLAIGVNTEAQCAAAVLERKFPDGQWSHKAREALKSAGLEPAEDEKNRTCQAIK
jgi:hypothetical protein